MTLRLRTLAKTLAALLLPLAGAIAAPPPADHPGAVIYRAQCAECHGNQGEGVAGKYDEPLTGDRGLESLARKIARTMPEEDPDLCTGEDAAQVAAYIYDAFYSPAARERIGAAGVDLTRLTVGQFRTSVMDVFGYFRGGNDKDWGSERGLRAYFRGPPPLTDEEREKMKPNSEPRKHTITLDEQRIPALDLAWKDESPAPDKIAPEEFNTRYEGSIIAPETGTYEFIVRSENGFRLWINDRSIALIDAWVTSGPEVREERASLFLVGGRAYLLNLEHFKFREKSASFQLLWKPPHGVEEVIPSRHLSPERYRQHVAVATPFPADDRSLGYERGSGVSRDWLQAVTQAATAAAEHAETRVDELAGTKPDDSERPAKLRKFAENFASMAFRREPDKAQLHFIEEQFKSAPSLELAVKRVVLQTLSSPSFLYPSLLETEPPDHHTVAARLALVLWDSIPDLRLRTAAREQRLTDREDVLRAARRLAADPRARAKMDGFFHHWLELDHAAETAKDPKAFPNFDQATLADLRTSLRIFLDETVWSEKSDYRELLQADYLYLNPRLAKIYGKKVKGADFEKVRFDPGQRAGIVTHPYLLSAFATARDTSPIHRGVFLTRNVVGLSLKSPPIAVAFEDSKFDPSLTMREKITELTRDRTCMSCHSMINPLGFSLENFDAIGRWRAKDNGKPVDATAELPLEDDRVIRLSGPRDIVKHVVDSPDGHRAFIRQLFHHLVKQPVSAYGSSALDDLQKSFAKSGFNIRELMAEIAVLAALRSQPGVS
jgi:hypothetical protein